MIVDERIATFINSMDSGNTEELNKIEAYALENFVPIIKQETQSLIKTLLAIKKPMNILEVGTAIGFSTLLMSEYAPNGCKITTIENYEKRIPIALKNISDAGKSDSITLIEGDANEVLKDLEGVFDFVFMDAAKGQYINFYPNIMRLLDKNGILVTDNVLQDGDIIESRYAVTRRNRTIHSSMREYLYELKHNNELETTIIAIGDGVAISVKK